MQDTDNASGQVSFWHDSDQRPTCAGCRRHLYGDIYSSPGLSLAQRQVLMCAFLGEANMHEQLFGHLLAVRTPQVSLTAASAYATGHLPLRMVLPAVKPLGS